MQNLRDRIAGHFTRFDRIALPTEGKRLAAVAIIVTPTDEGPAFLITRRALHLRRNAGNFALPGGGLDPGEDAIDAARRETREEVGVDLPREAVLGLLDDFETLGGHIVTPVVFWTGEPVSPVPNPEEVHLVLHVPLADLDHPEAPQREPHPDGGHEILRMFVRDRWLNPPTAAFLFQFREVCLHGRDCRTHEIGQPTWTAR